MQLQFQLNTAVSWRGSQGSVFCLGDASPLPPSTIPLASLQTEVIAFSDINVSIIVTWPPPEKPYGTIDLYEIVVTTTPLAERADPITESPAGTILEQSEVSGYEKHT